MKKYFKPLLLILIFSFILTACSNKEKDNGKEIEEVNNKGSKVKEEGEVLINDYPPTVMFNGKLYEDTGYINSGVTCGTIDSKIESSVSKKELPNKDLESNFGEDYGIQIWDDGYINIQIDDKWVIFKDVELDSNEIPEGVANFKGKVIEVSKEDILIDITEIPEFVQRIVEVKNIENEKPISISKENLKEISSISLNKGDNIQVWFDGQMTGIEKEMSYPIKLGKIYRIELIEE